MPFNFYSFLFQDPSRMEFNPWAVTSVKDLTYICCPECVFKTKEEVPFQVHALKNHPKSKVLFETPSELDILDEVHESKDSDMNGHKIEIHENGAFYEIVEKPMDICEDYDPLLVTNVTDVLDEHSYTRTSTDEIKCDHCAETFYTIKDLIDHSLKEHKSKKSEHKSAKEPSYVKESNGRKKWQCDHCDQTFRGKKQLIEHCVKAHEVKKDLNFLQCDHCDEQFLFQKTLAMHVKAKHDHEQKWKCDHCDHSFHLKKDLFNHCEKSHPNICLQCNLKFETPDEKAKHMNETHKHQKCDHCDSYFKSKQELIDHLVKEHGEEVKKVKCFLCPEEFNSLGKF